MASTIKYHYALDEKATLTSVEDVRLEDRINHRYTCLGCGAEMILKAGKVKARHFAHKVNTEHCGVETYLHKLAKRIVKNKFENGGKFEIEYVQTVRCADYGTCPIFNKSLCKNDVYKSFDLLKFYDTCEEEKCIDGYVADILLSDSTGKYSEPVLIEIHVSHKSSEQKIKSGLKIIEIKVSDEEDVNALSDGSFKESRYYRDEDNIHFFGFRREASKPEPLSCRYISKFILFESGKTFVQWRNTCREAMWHHASKSVLELLIEPRDLSPNYHIGVYGIGYVVALERGFDVRTCAMCRFHRPGEWPFAFFCCLYKKRGTPQNPEACEAMKCPHYTVDQSLVQDAMDDLNCSIVVDVTKK